MRTFRSTVAFPWRTTLHVLSIFGVASALVAFTAQPAAAYDWCSNDPVFTFRHGGLLNQQTLDVQVQVPLSAVPLSSAATLTVTVPLDVIVHETPALPIPGFDLQTVFVSGPANPDKSYPVIFTAVVPGSDPSVPVRLIITNPRGLPRGGKVTTVDGFVGTPLTATIQMGR